MNRTEHIINRTLTVAIWGVWSLVVLVLLAAVMVQTVNLAQIIFGDPRCSERKTQ